MGVGVGADNAGIHTWRETKRRGLIAGTPPRPGNPLWAGAQGMASGNV